MPNLFRRVISDSINHNTVFIQFKEDFEIQNGCYLGANNGWIFNTKNQFIHSEITTGMKSFKNNKNNYYMICGYILKYND